MNLNERIDNLFTGEELLYKDADKIKQLIRDVLEEVKPSDRDAGVIESMDQANRQNGWNECLEEIADRRRRLGL